MKSPIEFIDSFTSLISQVKRYAAYSICVDYQHIMYYESLVDGRGRWIGECRSHVGEKIRIQASLYLQDQRFARFYLSDDCLPTPEELVAVLSKQVEKSSQHASHVLPPQLDVRLTGLEIWDPRYPNIQADDIADVIAWNMDAIRNVSARVRGKQFSLEISQSQRIFRSSKTVLCEEKSTAFHLSGDAVLSSKPPRTLRREIFSRHFADVASRPISIKLARDLDNGERAIAMPKSFFYVVFEPEVVAALIQAMLPAFDEQRISANQSFLVGKFGQQIASKKVHIIDDGGLQNGVQTRAFDFLGVPPLPLTLIREGVVDCSYISPAVAQRKNLRPTGHSGYDNQLWPGNILVKAGRRSLNMILTEQEIALVATHLEQPIQLDILTGDLTMFAHFSQQGPGSKRGRLGVCKIQSNILTLLSQVVETANNQNRVGFVDASSWLLKDVEVVPLQEYVEDGEDIV